MELDGHYHVLVTLPPVQTRYPSPRRLSGRSGQARKISTPPEFDHGTAQPIAGPYTELSYRASRQCVWCCEPFPPEVGNSAQLNPCKLYDKMSAPAEINPKKLPFWIFFFYFNNVWIFQFGLGIVGWQCCPSPALSSLQPTEPGPSSLASRKLAGESVGASAAAAGE